MGAAIESGRVWYRLTTPATTGHSDNRPGLRENPIAPARVSGVVTTCCCVVTTSCCVVTTSFAVVTIAFCMSHDIVLCGDDNFCGGGDRILHESRHHGAD